MRRLFRLLSAAAVLGTASAALAGSGRIASISGPAEGQVLQRDGSDHATVHLAITVEGDVADVRVRVAEQGLSLPGFDWRSAAPAGNERRATLKDLPSGGPYDFEIMAVSSAGEPADVRTVEDVMIGDLWILAGQSNMEGVGKMEGAERPSGDVRMFDLTHRWRVAEEPLHSRPEAVYPVYWNVGKPKEAKPLEGEALRNFRNRPAGAGLGLAFAKELSANTGVPIGLVPCAYGGTSMDQWSPARRDEGGESLYGAMLLRHKAVGGKVKGVLWYQGESDAQPDPAAAYLEKFKAFIESVRRDFGQPALPFYWVQIGRFVAPDPPSAAWDSVRESQRKLESLLPAAGMVPAIDLALDDLIHADTAGLKTLGRRMANLAGVDLFPDKPAYRYLRRGPRLASLRFLDKQRRTLKIEFDGVNGRLLSGDRPAGFSVTIGDKSPGDIQPYKIRFDADSRNAVVLQFQKETPAEAKLWYGRGFDPYCNIRDEAGMAVPACGPLDLP